LSKTGACHREQVTLEAVSHPVPASVRLRRLLECALRTFAVKCVAIHDVGKDSEQPAELTSKATTRPRPPRKVKHDVADER
jgi:hypothetical protein